MTDELDRLFDEVWKEAWNREAERIARNLLVYGMSVQETAKLTGLYRAVVVRLRDTMRAER